MGQGRRARAQTASVPLKRFVTVYQPGGAVRSGANGDKYTPTGSETSFTLSPILAPLQPVQSRLIVADGLNLTCGDQSQVLGRAAPGRLGRPAHGRDSAGRRELSGQDVSVHRPGPGAAAVDGKAYGSLQLAVRWATGKSHGKLSPMNALLLLGLARRSRRASIRRTSSRRCSAPVSGTGGTGGTDANALALMRKKSILDFVDKKYNALKTKLGTDDQARLDQHLTQVRDLESRIVITTTPPPVTSACKQPTKVDTTGYNPTSALNSADDGSIKDTATDMKIPIVGQFMMDMMVMALACDKTGVISLQWTDTEAKHTFPWLNLSEHHHFYQHDGGFRPTECTQIETWYSQMHLCLAAEDAGRRHGWPLAAR